MTTSQPAAQPATQYVTTSGGKVGYDIQGEGPLVVLVPGMGELRSTYRFLAPTLVSAGYRVASMDLRGHGDSDTSFASYGDPETASDITALLGELGSPAVIAGNSMAAGAAVIVAAESPDLVDGLVLIGAYVREPQSASAFERLAFRVMMARPWAAAMWNAYLPKLYSGKKPTDFAEYRSSMMAALKRPGHTRAFSLTTRLNHVRAGESLAAVTAPAVVVMGTKDPDFKDPRAEAEWIGQTLGGKVVMIDDAGHYPQSQQPEQTSAAVIEFLSTLKKHA